MWETLKPFPLFFGGAQNQPQTRYVYNFNSVDSYISADIPIQVGDVLEFDFVAPLSYSATVKGAFVWDISTTLFARVDAGGTVAFGGGTAQIDGVALSFGDPLPADGIVHNIKITSTATTTIKTIAARVNTTEIAYFPIFNIKVNGGSVYNYPINDRTFGVGAPIANSATVLGGELWLNPVLGDWLDNGDGSYTLNGDGSYQPLGQIAINSNDTYLVEITVDALNGGTLSAYNQATHRALTVGKNVFLIAGGSRLDIVRLNGAITATVRNISLKKANGYATGVNLLESGWQEIPL